jgi:chromosome segregation ATPase
MDEGALSLDLVLMSDEQLRHRALVEANRRIAELERHMANVRQRSREASLALREAELMQDSSLENLRTANASIARLREALTEAREHIADTTPEETRAKIDAALQAASAPAQTRPRSGSPIASTKPAQAF